VAQYRVVERLQRHPLGPIYLAEPLATQSRFAMHVLHDALASDEQVRARFAEAAPFMPEVSHPNIVPAIEFGEVYGMNYAVRPLVLGPTGQWTRLDQQMAGFPEGRVPIERVRRWAIQLTRVLAYTHDHRILHHFLSPGSIIVTDTGDLQVMDYGLGHIVGDTWLRKLVGVNHGDEPFEDRLTLVPASDADELIGYLSPEWRSGHSATEQSDLYSLGALIYRMLTGQLPSPGETTPSAHLPELPAWWDELVASLLADEPGDRPSTTAPVLEELQRDRETPPPVFEEQLPTPRLELPRFKPSPMPIIVASVLVLLLIGVAVGHWYRYEVLPSVFGPRPGSTVTNSIGMELAFIPPGEFVMGSPDSQRYRGEDERQHSVRLSYGYYIGTTEVSNQQFALFVDETDYITTAERNGASYALGEEVVGLSWQNPIAYEYKPDRPVTSVSYVDAQKFCEWLSAREGKTYRLPTEAEWEYAARAGKQTPFPWGFEAGYGAGWANVKDWSAGQFAASGATFNFSDGYPHTSPVGDMMHANRWGLYDTIGNVWEWCENWYHIYPEGRVVDPVGPEDGVTRSLRGGSCYDGPVGCRLAARAHASPDRPNLLFGFRVVLEIPGQQPKPQAPGEEQAEAAGEGTGE